MWTKTDYEALVREVRNAHMALSRAHDIAIASGDERVKAMLEMLLDAVPGVSRDASQRRLDEAPPTPPAAAPTMPNTVALVYDGDDSLVVVGATKPDTNVVFVRGTPPNNYRATRFHQARALTELNQGIRKAVEDGVGVTF